MKIPAAQFLLFTHSSPFNQLYLVTFSQRDSILNKDMNAYYQRSLIWTISRQNRSVKEVLYDSSYFGGMVCIILLIDSKDCSTHSFNFKKWKDRQQKSRKEVVNDVKVVSVVPATPLKKRGRPPKNATGVVKIVKAVSVPPLKKKGRPPRLYC